MRSFIKYLISIPGDSDIKDSSIFQFPTKVIGSYIVEGRKHIVEAFNRMIEGGYAESVEFAKEKLYLLLSDSHLNYLGTPLMIPNIAIVDCFNSLSKASRVFNDPKIIKFKFDTKYIDLERKLHIEPRSDLDPEAEISKLTGVFLVRKPDFLNDSQWQIVYNGKTIRANLHDSKFILDFLNRKVDLKPGDSIRADAVMRTQGRQQVIDIKRVLSVLPADGDAGQLPII